MHQTFAPLALLLLSGTLAQASVKVEAWGTTSDGQAQLFTLSDADLTVRLSNYGAHIVSIDAPDRNGQKADVVLGHKDLAGYQADTSTYFGAIVGRYGNRIAKGTFTLDGHTYHVPLNNGPNALHGGPVGFDKKLWKAKPLSGGNGVEFTLISPDGDMGFPGKLTTHVTYTLDGKSLHIDYTATTDKPTIVNLTNHSYFNLSGEGSGDVLGEVVTLNADRYTPVDATLIPTGQLAPVAGTPMDFRQPTPIGKNIHASNQQLKFGGGGYDLNFVLNGAGQNGPRPAAHVFDPKSGRSLTVTTTEPGVQFYTANGLGTTGTVLGTRGEPYGKYGAFCLETQHFPDAPNHPNFASTTLRPGQTFHSTTVFTFGVGQ